MQKIQTLLPIEFTQDAERRLIFSPQEPTKKQISGIRHGPPQSAHKFGPNSVSKHANGIVPNEMEKVSCKRTNNWRWMRILFISRFLESIVVFELAHCVNGL